MVAGLRWARAPTCGPLQQVQGPALQPVQEQGLSEEAQGDDEGQAQGGASAAQEERPEAAYDGAREAPA